MEKRRMQGEDGRGEDRDCKKDLFPWREERWERKDGGRGMERRE